jgi:dTDP-4-amino-4,6-dideoxygalactose transaminase
MANNLEMSNARIAVAAPTLNGNEKRYVLECLETTWISSIGRFITEFERAFTALNMRLASAMGRPHCTSPWWP